MNKELFNLIDQSKLTLIGYTFHDERIKNELISNFNYVEIEEINSSSFNIKSFLRNLKLDQILNGQKVFDYILLDLINIRTPLDHNPFWSKPHFIRQVLETLRENTKYKIIISSPLNRDMKGDDMTSFVGGSGPVYISDLVVTLKGNTARVTKNRFGCEMNDYILYDTKQNVEI